MQYFITGATGSHRQTTGPKLLSAGARIFFLVPSGDPNACPGAVRLLGLRRDPVTPVVGDLTAGPAGRVGGTTAAS